MKQIIDGCQWRSCPKRWECYRYTLPKRKNQFTTFSWWNGCKNFWNESVKKQII